MEQVFFKNIQSAIISELQQATQSIQIALCWFTNKAIFDVLAQKASEGVVVSMILLDDYANKRKEGLPLNDLVAWGAKIYFSDKTAPIHHKFCVIDKVTLLSGSYDWTYFSESKALENLLIIKENQEIIDAFLGEFEMLTSVLSPLSSIAPYTLSEGLVKDMFGLKNYLSEDVYLQALKADENGEDLHALNLMHHSAKIDEYKIEAQTEFIKEKQINKVENGDSAEENQQMQTQEEPIQEQEEEEEETPPTPVYTSRGIGLGFTPTVTVEEEQHEENTSEEIIETPYTEEVTLLDNTSSTENLQDAATTENSSESTDAAPISTEQNPTQEYTEESQTQSTENQPIENNDTVITEIPPAPPEFVPNPEAENAIQQGEVAYQQGRLDDAVQFFMQAMMLQSDNPKAYLNLAIVKWRMGRFSEQAEFAAQSIQHDPTNAKAFNTLALAQDKMSNFTDAILNYSKALELSPDNYSYLWNRAVALKQIGRRQEAVVDFGKVVKLCNQVVMANPANQNAKMTMEAAMKEMGS
jgi:tetratricopeptide (TPR) repeat protein